MSQNINDFREDGLESIQFMSKEEMQELVVEIMTMEYGNDHDTAMRSVENMEIDDLEEFLCDFLSNEE